MATFGYYGNGKVEITQKKKESYVRAAKKISASAGRRRLIKKLWGNLEQ